MKSDENFWMIQWQRRNKSVNYKEMSFPKNYKRNDVEKYLRKTKQIGGRLIHLRKVLK